MKFSQVKIDLEMLDVGSIIEDEPLYKHTTYKVGGPARIYLKVKDIDSLVKTIKYCRKHRVKHIDVYKRQCKRIDCNIKYFNPTFFNC